MGNFDKPMSFSPFDIGSFRLEPGGRPMVVAELSGNHAQDLKRARDLIRTAAECGADAVKLQTYDPAKITLPVRKPDFLIGAGPHKGKMLYDLYRLACTPYEWHAELAEYARQLGLILFSSPFDEDGVGFLAREIDPPAYKVASPELVHLPLLRRIAEEGKPVLVSTGMGSESEIERALLTLREVNPDLPVILLKCVSSYPASPEGFHLRSMVRLGERFGTATGLSDHTLSSVVALGATALGASMIEKHFTFDRSDGGVDSDFSMEPDDLRALVESVKTLHAALGSPEIGATQQDEGNRQFRRSIYVARTIRKGEAFTTDSLQVVRPAFGLDPARWDEVIGRSATRNLEAGDRLAEGDWV